MFRPRGIEKERLGTATNLSKSERQLTTNSKEFSNSDDTTNKSGSRSERNLVKTNISSQSMRDVSDTMEDDEHRSSAHVLKFQSSGFNRLKGMWTNRETTSGFSNPLSTWTRSYGAQTTKKEGIHVQFDDNTKTYTAAVETPEPEQVFTHFGKPIADCPRTKLDQYTEGIPSVLITLRDELEKAKGFYVEGVFRVAASFDDQKLYKVQIDQGTFQGCKNTDDAMCMAALIKEWFRTMPVRLLNALPLEAMRKGHANCAEQLPEPNLSVLLWLCDLMADICALEQINRMSVRAMAIVVAPNLYSTHDQATPAEIMQETNGAVSIVEQALKERLVQRKGPEPQQEESRPEKKSQQEQPTDIPKTTPNEKAVLL